MKLRKKLAMLLASTIIVASVPIMTIAASTSYVSKVVTGPVGSELETTLVVDVKDMTTATTHQVIYLDLTGAKFNEDKYGAFILPTNIVNIEMYGDKTLKICLNETILREKIYIPIFIRESEEGEMSIAIDGDGTKAIDNATVIVAKVSDAKVVVAGQSPTQIEKQGEIATITISEPFKNVLNGKDIILTLEDSDYEFIDAGKVIADWGFTDEIGFSAKIKSKDNRQIIVTVPSNLNNEAVGRIKFEGIKVNCLNQDIGSEKIKVTVSGENIQEATLVVAENTYEGKNIEFNDIRFKQALIDRKVDVNGDNQISEKEMLEITSLNLSNYNISNIEEIEYAKNLKTLWLSHNEIQDIVSLAELDKLTFLDISYNKLKDINRLPENIYQLLDIRHNYINLDEDSLSRMKINHLISIGSRVDYTPQIGTVTPSSSSGGGGASTTQLTIEQRINKLSDTEKQNISKRFKEELPYTRLSDTLLLNQFKKLTNNKFTDKELQAILDKPESLKELGIDINVISKEIILVPINDVVFKDVSEEHWANSSIRKATELGLVAGMPDGTFEPSSPLQIVDTFTFLDRVLLLNDVVEMKLSKSIVEKYITNKEHWAFYNMASIGSKLSEETLGAITKLEDDMISRELLAQILYELTDGKLKVVKEAIEFQNVQQSPYQEAIKYCIETGLLNGVSQNKMLPQKALTRAELMAVLIRLNELLKVN